MCYTLKNRFNGDASGILVVNERSSMNKDKSPISVIALRAEHYSSDGKDIIISVTVKFANAERKYSVPVECFYDLIVDLQRLHANRDLNAGDASSQPSVAISSTEKVNA
jgi:hypothetical protein